MTHREAERERGSEEGGIVKMRGQKYFKLIKADERGRLENEIEKKAKKRMKVC